MNLTSDTDVHKFRRNAKLVCLHAVSNRQSNAQHKVKKQFQRYETIISHMNLAVIKKSRN